MSVKSKAFSDMTENSPQTFTNTDSESLQRYGSNTSAKSQSLHPIDESSTPQRENPWLDSQEQLIVNGQPSESTPSFTKYSNTPSTPRPDSKRRRTSPIKNRPSPISRHSIPRMFPAPLSSPLSASLTGIVADTLRRGLDSPVRLRRHQSSGSKLTTSQANDDIGADDGRGPQSASLFGSRGTERAEDGETGSKDTGSKGRSKSLGDALGAIFQMPRSRRDAFAVDEESAVESEHETTDTQDGRG